MPLKPYLEAGQIVGTHGVRGEVRVQPWCDSSELFATLRRLYWDDAGARPVAVRSRPHKRIALTQIEGIDNVTEAAALRGRMLYLSRGDLKLAPGRYFIRDLLGAEISDVDTGTVYGTLTEVSATGANDVYHMDMDGKEVLIPAVPSVVIHVDVEAGQIKIRPLEGLFTV